jgi:hypothetical protein
MAKSKVAQYRDNYVGYDGAHGRVRRMWGSASQYDCIRCGDEAESWAYDHSDPEELCEPEHFQKGGRAYSPWPEFYAPMCWPCHSKFDRIKTESPSRMIREGDQFLTSYNRFK